jgi:hypothetical protein
LRCSGCSTTATGSQSSGLHGRAYAEHFPGWSWNELLAVCKAAGIVAGSGTGAPLRCDPRVRVFHFTDARKFAVEWNDGTVTVRDPHGAVG